MKLNRKTFVYSIVLSLIIIILFLGYMLLMLPSLYVEHTNRKNERDILDVHFNYVEDKKYIDELGNNPINSISLFLKESSYKFEFNNFFFEGDISIQDEKTKKEIDDFRNKLDSKNFEFEEIKKNTKEFKIPKKVVDEINKSLEEYAYVNLKTSEFARNYFNNIKSYNEVENLGENTFLLINKSDIDKNAYTNYMIITSGDEGVYLSFFSLLTPLITDIQSAIYTSIPMIVLVILLLAFFISRYFSKKIVNPILKISKHIEERKNWDIKPLEIKTNDEIEQLSERLNELHQQLRENYEKLKDENKRREVFMRASSHQLKTPVTSALLLTNGMIDSIGKYEDRDKYLVEVKKQLMEINNIISEILDLNHINENLEFNNISLNSLINTILDKYSILIEEKNLNIEPLNSDKVIFTDYEIIYKILDNLIGNAIKFSPNNSSIKFIIKDYRLKIINTNTFIPKELEGIIFEPFVSSNIREKGHGLGLYLALYYAELLGFDLIVKNIDEGVLAEVDFSGKYIKSSL
ncbi:HAMP domain-containing sensor histidine kinase [Miniphocaeibacter halophilus]|uniref:HAMP domain-containing histidine kinase n=1 Tax=Miniphocaeibacter halophilus TaxID=2931922 RepID=A0AC61MSG1_9FIRM|nr:HAMP domain-containing sensor histidine kinase [Miniphocaeibacter halophilus]QQK08487.1 HAMP domain-containing histidine kinase [Miniphocaeibacter halophilus]